MKKKSVAKAKIFFLLKVRGQPASWRTLHCCLLSFAECHTEQNFDCLFSEGSDRRSSFDRSDWSVAVKVGKRIWLRLCRMPESSAQKFGETNCENPFACEHTSSRGPSALYFSHKTHAKRKNQPFPTSRMGVARGCGPHLQPRRLKKLKKKIFTFRSGMFKFLDTSGWEGWVGLFGLFPTFRRSALPMPISPFFPTMYQHTPLSTC